MKNPNPNTLILRKDIFKICSCDYLEAHILEFFLSGEFDKPNQATLDEICESVFLSLRNSTKVRSSVIRLLDKGYLKDVTTEARDWRKRGDPKFWVVCQDVVMRDIKRLKLK